jgi:hypothetical protein
MNDKRLVWTAKGCMWAGVMGKDGIHQLGQLHDFNGMKFEPLAAPYEGGLPIRPSLVSPPPVGVKTRKGPRPLARKKPNRSKVHPHDDSN